MFKRRVTSLEIFLQRLRSSTCILLLILQTCVFAAGVLWIQIRIPNGFKDPIDIDKSVLHAIESQQYCMLWCKNDDAILQSDWLLYLNHTDQESSKFGSYYNTGGRDKYHLPTMDALNVRCCQIVTRKNLEVIHDSRAEGDDDVTLVIIGTVSRISALKSIRERWGGPIVYVLYFTDYNDLLLRKNNESTSSEDLMMVRQMVSLEGWSNILILAYTAKFDTDKIALRIGVNAFYRTSAPSKAYSGQVLLSQDEALRQNLMLVPEFPINTMRNMAVDAARTNFIFPVDADFLPDSEAYEFIRSQRRIFRNSSKVALIFPHFEKRKCSWLDEEYVYPYNFQELDYQYANGLIRPFHCELSYWLSQNAQVFNINKTVMEKSTNCNVSEVSESSPTNPLHSAGIRLIDYAQWMKQSRQNSFETYEIPYDISSSKEDLMHFEPFLVFSRFPKNSMIRYNEVFVSRYYNKVSFVSSFRLSGYKFLVALNHFLIHQDHSLTHWTDKVSKSDSGYILHNNMQTAIKTYIDTLSEIKRSS